MMMLLFNVKCGQYLVHIVSQICASHIPHIIPSIFTVIFFMSPSFS